MKIGFIPLDDRPCNLKFPLEIAALAGAEVICPPKEYLGSFTKQGITAEITRWFVALDEQIDAFVISSDMVAYGGLVASRTVATTLDQALSRIKAVSNSKYSSYIFSTLMRLSITASSTELASHWKQIMKFSELSDKPGTTQEELEHVKNIIPEELLKVYLDARNRNFNVNRNLIEMIDGKIFQYLVIGKEDVAQFGLHRKEERDLRKLHDDLNIIEKTKIINGTDELGQMLIVRAALDSKNLKPKIFVKYSIEVSSNIISLFEDRSIDIVADDHINVIGAARVKDIKKADIVLYVHTPNGMQEDLFLGSGTGLKKALKVEKEVKEIKELLDGGYLVAVADVAYCNGADPEFALALIENIDITKLTSFAAWNTTSNSIGSALAFAIANLLSEVGGRKSEVILERFIDDYLYQSVVRPKIIKFCSGKNISIYNLGDDWKSVEKVVNDLMREEINRFKQLSAVSCQLSVKLPWPRVFEVEIL